MKAPATASRRAARPRRADRADAALPEGAEPSATAHVHTWTPIDGQRAAYRCACGHTGWRGGGGEIYAHRQRLLAPVEPTVRPLTAWGGAVPARPDEAELSRRAR